jgi:hypothetical protein
MTKLSTLILIARRWLDGFSARVRLGAQSATGWLGALFATRNPGAPPASHRSGAPTATRNSGAPTARRRPRAPSLRRYLGMFPKIRAGYVSILIVIGVAVAAVYTLPLGAGPGAAAPIWRVPRGGPTVADGTELPVFCLPETGPALRCGVAKMRSRRRISFQPFGDMPDPHETLPVLATADIGLLWSLADPAARSKVQASATELAAQVASSVQQVTDSPAWQHEYRESLRDVLERTTQEAWRAEDTQQAFRALLRASEPVVKDSLAHQIGPALAPYIADAFWSLLKTNSAQVLSLISGSPLDLSPIGSTFSVALQDPRVQVALGGIGPRLADLPQTELLTERFLANLAEALRRDHVATALLTRVAMDSRLGTELGHVRNHVGEFMRQLGEVLWGLGGSSSMNALAGLSMKTQIAGVSQPLIILLGNDDAATLVRTMPDRATLLVPETVP